MRSVNFRDSVLWAIAYKGGKDPANDTNFLKNQAASLASFINAWVRRLYDAADWPEWTAIHAFIPDGTHVVGWDSLTADGGPPTEGPHPLPPEPFTTPSLGKVLKVYLVDPRTTWTPVDTPFRLFDEGIHCGFEHGPSVWIKYLPRCPQFTASQWDVNARYNKDDLAYSPLTGECYKSKTSNNLGHDPSQPGGTSGPLMAPLVDETAGATDNPGLGATPEIVDIFAAYAPPITLALPDPPPSVSNFNITVKDNTGTTLGTATHTATGSQSLATIYADLAAQLTAALTGFTVTLVTTPQLKIRLQHASDFNVGIATFSVTGNGGTTYPLNVVQVQPYVPSVPPSTGQGQSFKLTLTDDQVVPGATYHMCFTTVDSIEHEVDYVALSTDNAAQILNGLINTTIALQPTDPFFTGVTSSLDAASPSATFTITGTLGLVSLDAQVLPPGSTFWELVPFPFALVDQVVRGAYADWLKEGGQTDKGNAEEQAVPTEQTVRTTANLAQQYDQLSDQQQPRSRYAIK